MVGLGISFLIENIVSSDTWGETGTKSKVSFTLPDFSSFRLFPLLFIGAFDLYEKDDIV